MGFPMNVMGLFMNMEEQMSEDWDNGFGKLKKLTEEDYAVEKAREELAAQAAASEESAAED
ncbi:hypothetical protein N8368_03005 [Bacteroidia bacterium]|nr:hypothetical protein [Bacteroidia bacterium]MDC1395457.1 hypothetical protein [Bacteroidia bacterium]